MSKTSGPLTGGATVGLLVGLGFLVSWVLQVVFAALAVPKTYEEPITSTTNAKTALVFTWLTLGLTLYIMFYAPYAWGWFQYLFIALAALAASFATVLVATEKINEPANSTAKSSTILSITFAGSMGVALVLGYLYLSA